MKHKDGTVYSDVPAPANGRRYVSRSPTRVDISLIVTPELDNVLFVLGVPMVMLHLLGSISI